MPISSGACKKWTANWVRENQEKITRVLDIGCGAGTYPNLLKGKHNLLTSAEWVGVEVWQPYIDRFNLHEKYDNIINEDVRKIDFKKLGRFNLCIMGDVLEHMTKEESVTVVNSILDVCDRALISIPVVHFPQGESEGNPYEVHVKDDWSDTEVKETFPNILDSYQEKKIGVYLLGKNPF